MNTILIGIAGGTGSGKTTLTRHLKEHFGKDVTVIGHDSYYKRQVGRTYDCLLYTSMEKSKLLDRCGAEGEDRLLLAKVLDRAAQAEERNIPACTDFLSPQQQMMAGDLLRLAGIPETAWLRQGGYQGAERNILLFLPDWMEPETAEPPLRCLRAAFRTEDRLSHRDILGSLMGMGIVREKVGDILVSPESADLIVLDTVADFLLSSWNSAGRARLTVTEIPAAHLHIPEVRCEEVLSLIHIFRPGQRDGGQAPGDL